MKRLNPPLSTLRRVVYTARFLLKMTSFKAVAAMLALAFVTGSMLIAALAAAVTNAAVVLSWTWEVDHYEEEPWRLVAKTLIWGAVPAIVLAATAQTIFHSFGGYLLGGPPERLWEVGVVAPIVEEISKGVVLVFLFRRHRDEFDGMVDGLLYGALVGIGFSMSENVGYYLQAEPARLEDLVFVRGILFGMNHAVFSGCFGLGLGVARDSTSSTTRWLAPLVGLTAGIALHAGHNVLVTGSNGQMAIPLGALAAGGWFYLVARARRREAAWIREGLAPELEGKIVNGAEIEAMCSAKTRAATLRHALLTETEPGLAHLALQFYAVATELAFARHRAKLEPENRRHQERVDRLRKQLAALRAPYRDQVIVIANSAAA
jgi:RsiW-degrading membrane proteinase PrsW (M82 family)